MEVPPPKNPQADQIPAQILTQWVEPPLFVATDHNWYGPPGTLLYCNMHRAEDWLLCCPGCGLLAAPKDGQSWTVTSGTHQQAQGLSFHPSIARTCCGWHGWLTNGVFTTKSPGG